MGTNACWIQLESLGGATAPELIREIERYWVGRGARVVGHTREKLEPMSLRDTGRLGYLVMSPDEGWTVICDSERYTADFGLARHLAATLGRTVRFLGIWDASGDELDLWLQGDVEVEPPAELPITPGAYYLDAKAREIAAAVVFEGIDTSMYDEGPEPESPPDDELQDLPALHGRFVERLDAAGAIRWVQAAPPEQRGPLIPVLFSTSLDLAQAAPRRFVAAVGAALIDEALSPGQRVRVAEAAARERDAALLERLRPTLAAPPGSVLLKMVADRLEKQGVREAAALLRALLPPP